MKPAKIIYSVNSEVYTQLEKNGITNVYGLCFELVNDRLIVVRWESKYISCKASYYISEQVTTSDYESITCKSHKKAAQIIAKDILKNI